MLDAGKVAAAARHIGHRARERGIHTSEQHRPATQASLSGQARPGIDQREEWPAGYQDDDAEEEQFSEETLVRFLPQEFSADVAERRTLPRGRDASP
jgi:hypothetical protein